MLNKHDNVRHILLHSSHEKYDILNMLRYNSFREKKRAMWPRLLGRDMALNALRNLLLGNYSGNSLGRAMNLSCSDIVGYRMSCVHSRNDGGAIARKRCTWLHGNSITH